MHKTTWFFVSLVSLLAAIGCTTTDDKPGTSGAAGAAAGGPYTPTPNGLAINEQEACDALRGAFEEHATRLGCTFTLPMCPEYIRLSGAPQCSQYDDGTISGCADFYAGFTDCSEFEPRRCQIYNIADSAPAGCPIQDAGTDVETEVDAEADAGPDAETDAASEDAAAE